MTLTIRLYRFDEVRAALLYSIRMRRVTEAQFWLRELEESQYGSEAERLLFVGWFMFAGLLNIQWLLQWCRGSSTVAERQRLCFQLCQLPDRDSSLWWLLVSVPLIESDSRVCEVWRHKCTLDGEDFWQSLVDSSTDERIDEILEGLQTDLKGYTLMAKAAAVAITTCKLQKSTWNELSQRSVEEFLPELMAGGLRKERSVEIPYMCLFGMSWRGRGATTDLCQLSVPDFVGSPLWRKRIAGYLNTEQGWKSDEDLEAFWDTYFPWVSCDHPDEWSAADRKKSHGEGVNCAIGAPLWRWWKNWIPPSHMWIWGPAKYLCWKWVQEQRSDVGDTVLHRVFELYKGLEGKELDVRKPKVFVLEER